MEAKDAVDLSSSSSAPVRIVLCTHSSAYSDIVLTRLTRCPSVVLAGLVDSTRILQPLENAVASSVKTIMRSGLLYSGYLLVVTTPSLRIGEIPPWKSTTDWARHLAVPLHRTKTINDAAGQGFLDSCKPDIILSANFNQLFKPQLIDALDAEFWNIHPSRLPSYKGPDPVFHAMLAKEDLIGVSLHKIDDRLDCGPILAQRSRPLVSKSLTANYLTLFADGSDLVCETIEKGLANVTAVPQVGEGHYDTWPSRKDVYRFLARNNRF